MSGDPADVSLLELFQVETETQSHVLASGLLALERDPGAGDQIEACMRAAHSLKGAASIVGVTVGVRVAHAMEDCFVAAQRGGITLGRTQIDLLLGATDLLLRISETTEPAVGDSLVQRNADIDVCLSALLGMLPGGGTPATASLSEPPPVEPVRRRRVSDGHTESDRMLRVTAENLNRLLGLAGESLVGSRWLQPFAESLLKLKRLQHQSSKSLNHLRDSLSAQQMDERARAALAGAQALASECEHVLSQRLIELEMFDRRSLDLASRLYDEALGCRMRPFADGVGGFPRMLRDVAHSLGKQVRLEIIGETTQVDRDILTRLDAPLGHLLRNAVDHGLESPDERRAAGKPAEGVVRLEARHSGGALQVSISDDGRGVDVDALRRSVVERKLIDAAGGAALSETELMEFLFLPGFSMKGTVTDISGRGVGLDVVQDMVRQVRGTVRVSSQPGRGTRFQLQVPVTLSVVRTLLVEIGGEPYAIALAHIIRTIKLPKDQIEILEGRQHFDFDGRRIGLITAQQVLETGKGTYPDDDWSVIVIGDPGHTYGLVVDRFLGERDMVVQPLAAQLGKIQDIAAGALMPDGTPVLIIDTDDLIRSIDKLVSGGRVSLVQQPEAAAGRKRKRVLIVDDSFTVREVERKLLASRGYDVEVAVDGMDGWNAVRTGRFDLVVTDIDMPRMDGIELVTLITKAPNLKSLPVMVVSYKDRGDDRRRGLEAGAAHYLTKGSFHDDTLLVAVVDLIGEAHS